MKDKLENPFVYSNITKANVICLNEIKTDKTFGIPGYKTFTSGGPERHRGGVAVLIDNKLSEDLVRVDCSNPDVVIFRFASVPITFIACYIPPLIPRFSPLKLCR